MGDFIPYTTIYDRKLLAERRKERIEVLYEMKRKLQENFCLPEYERDREFYSSQKNGIREPFNCYAYAMQFSTPVSMEERTLYPYYIPGFLSGEFVEPFDSKNLVDAFEADCEFLGLDCNRKVNPESTENDGYNVSVFIIGGGEEPKRQKHLQRFSNPEFVEFHFIRKNKHNIWSHLGGWGAYVTDTSTPTEEDDYTYIETVNISRKK